MRILLIEDDPSWSERVIRSVTSIIPRCEFTVVTDRDDANRALLDPQFDLIVCDLKIPVNATSPEPDEAHGVAVLDQIEVDAPGLRVVVLSAFGNLDILQPYLMRNTQADYFGTGTTWAMRDHVLKDKVDQWLSEMESFDAELAEIERIDIDGAVAAKLSRDDVRILRAFTRLHNGVISTVVPLEGGRSSARTLRVEVRNAANALTCLTVAKLDLIESVLDEKQRYFARVSALLAHGSHTAHSGEAIVVGSATRGGLFYTLLEGYEESLFDCLQQDEARAASIVAALKANLGNWHQNRTAASVPLRELREKHAEDANLTDACLSGLDYATEEARDVYVWLANGHGDLHGSNVLVSVDGNPVLIDFGRVSELPASFDPVTLELSAICHPDANLDLGDWPTIAQWKAWLDIDTFVAGSPIESYVRACRVWANDVKRSERELLACAYAYLVRQVTYGNVPENVLEAAVEGLLNALAAR